MLMSYLVKQRTGHMEKKDKSKNKEVCVTICVIWVSFEKLKV